MEMNLKHLSKDRTKVYTRNIFFIVNEPNSALIYSLLQFQAKIIQNFESFLSSIKHYSTMFSDDFAVLAGGQDIKLTLHKLQPSKMSTISYT